MNAFQIEFIENHFKTLTRKDIADILGISPPSLSVYMSRKGFIDKSMIHLAHSTKNAKSEPVNIDLENEMESLIPIAEKTGFLADWAKARLLKLSEIPLKNYYSKQRTKNYSQTPFTITLI